MDFREHRYDKQAGLKVFGVGVFVCLHKTSAFFLMVTDDQSPGGH